MYCNLIFIYVSSDRLINLLDIKGNFIFLIDKRLSTVTLLRQCHVEQTRKIKDM